MEFCSLVSVDIAVNLAAITFNHGLEGLEPLFVQLIGSPRSVFIAHYITSSDDKRLKKAGQSAQARDGESPCDLWNWRWRKDTSLRKASPMSLVHFYVPSLFFFSFFFLEVDFFNHVFFDRLFSKPLHLFGFFTGFFNPPQVGGPNYL